MRSLALIRARTPKREILRGQLQHAMLALLITVGAGAMLHQTQSRVLGLSAIHWAYLAMGVALVHQIMVAVVFRLQLHFDVMVRLFGGRALRIWGLMFLPLLVARPTTVLLAGWADAGSLGGSRGLQFAAGLALLAPAIWAMHSVLKYFTIPRALGGDHFFDRYLNMAMVERGAFRYSANAMYSFVFLGFWAIALLSGSWNALVLALFNHAYVWVHMYCTEDPDMGILYAPGAGDTPAAQPQQDQ